MTRRDILRHIKNKPGCGMPVLCEDLSVPRDALAPIIVQLVTDGYLTRGKRGNLYPYYIAEAGLASLESQNTPQRKTQKPKSQNPLGHADLAEPVEATKKELSASESLSIAESDEGYIPGEDREEVTHRVTPEEARRLCNALREALNR